jgi:putative transposase
VHRDWFGASASVLHERFKTWREFGVFQRIMRKLVKYYAKRRNVKRKWQAIDRKACPAPLGGEETGRNPTDRGKQGSKIHLLVDKRGAPLAVFITGANRHDKTAALSVIVSVEVERPEREQHLCADKAYDAADFREFLVLEGITPHIKRNPRGSKDQDYQDSELCHAGLGECTYPARRWVVERTLSWLVKRRSIRTRWTKKAENWLAFVQLACAHILCTMGSQ